MFDLLNDRNETFQFYILFSRITNNFIRIFLKTYLIWVRAFMRNYGQLAANLGRTMHRAL